MTQRLNAMLEATLAVSQRRTLLINALGMGVRVPASNVVSFDAGLRADSVIAVVKGAQKEFDQILLVGEHPFIKRIIEEGIHAGIDWRARPLFIQTGGEVVPEGFRTYIGNLVGHDVRDPSKGAIFISLGVSEVGLMIGQETPTTILLRKVAASSEDVGASLFRSQSVPTYLSSAK